VVSAVPAAITTVLGSCVAVCLFDPETGVGGMNHFLLPLHVERERSPRFGTVAVPMLIDELVKSGAHRPSIRAKLFGGGSVLAAFRRSGRLGEENAALAIRLLAEAGIPVLEKDLGGRIGRKVIFHTDDGSAWVRSLLGA
jgi:chemotaxis protein CheD